MVDSIKKLIQVRDLKLQKGEAFKNGVVFKVSNCDNEIAHKIFQSIGIQYLFVCMNSVADSKFLNTYQQLFEIDKSILKDSPNNQCCDEYGYLPYKFILTYFHDLSTLIGVKVTPYTFNKDIKKYSESIKKRVLCQDI